MLEKASNNPFIEENKLERLYRNRVKKLKGAFRLNTEENNWEAMYHNICRKCHIEMQKANEKTGTVKCVRCHG